MSEELKKVIDEYNAVCQVGEYPDYRQQEDIKHASWNAIRYFEKEKNFSRACRFLMHGIIRMHYWRARMAIEDTAKPAYFLRKIRGKKYYKGYELDIDHYTCHWLWANGDRRDLFSEETLEHAIKDWGYKLEENKYLPKGMSVYQFETIPD